MVAGGALWSLTDSGRSPLRRLRQLQQVVGRADQPPLVADFLQSP